MTGKIAYTILNSCQHLQHFIYRWTAAAIFLLSFFSATLSFTQEEQEFEEILVFLHVRNVGGTELPAYIQGSELFLPVTDVFSFLKIQNTPSPGFDSVSGFFLNPLNVFLVDRANNRIHYQHPVTVGNLNLRRLSGLAAQPFKMFPGALPEFESRIEAHAYGEELRAELVFSRSGVDFDVATLHKPLHDPEN